MIGAYSMIGCLIGVFGGGNTSIALLNIPTARGSTSASGGTIKDRRRV